MQRWKFQGYIRTRNSANQVACNSNMPDLFDNFFNKISSSVNGGKTTPRYSGSSQVNTGNYYSYHMNGSNNKSWMTSKEIENSFIKAEGDPPKPRLGSISSMESDSKSRSSSISE
ncbi:putative COX assembly protein [Clavispora lusitaniae]|uniref:Uncharacterized protein n=3 Tax=Clavispora lusitaniae TaxID=36911 RepID=C4Y447_CLAL4|nr:uncharacterized protein CLUG_02419 [Clavispora lusitaniae ATCC 42720]KAF5211452.1 hypothetical protein E0198_002764 [Clavispora lusitaniae]EEQ38293.1 hypothetical protein CLUG_02419 [Clavispora lusitaniae ATCC 42720]KAF7580306.1 hypothetical protein FOB63_005376 [Clavispora lusitaniae]QFZ27872.1 putative COX assembly protein [Clavispora lusitaniae]QFZ32821.1 putative COX assembly protein [Clavispora lusitaniae]